MEKKQIALAMAERLEKLAVGLEMVGLVKEASVNRAKAAQIREAAK